MNELQVSVKQTPGVIIWNYEELKTALTAKMKEYQNTVYTDDTIDEAASDLAKLRKLKKAVNDRKIEIKKKCLEPYDPIESQAKELMGLIEGPITAISANVSAYETARKGKRKDEIIALMKDTFSDLPEKVSAKLVQNTYDSRWENKTAKQKDWTDAILKAHEDTVQALKIIGNCDEDFRDEVMKVYVQNLSVTDALRHAQYLQRQKEIVLERERQRREAEARRAEEERRRKEEERVLKEQQEKTEEERPVDAVPEKENVAQILKEEQEKTKENVHQILEQQAEEDQKNPVRTILFHGTDAQLSKVLGYIKYLGARYELR